MYGFCIIVKLLSTEFGVLVVPAFRDSIDVPLVVRRLHKSRKEVRLEKNTNEYLNDEVHV